MKNSRNISIVCALLLAAITLSSCSKSPADSLVGKWVVQGESATVEFRKDGTLTSTENNNHVTTGTYKFSDRTHMEMQIIEPDAKQPITIACEVVVKGDKASITLTMPSNDPSKPEAKTALLRRVK